MSDRDKAIARIENQFQDAPTPSGWWHDANRLSLVTLLDQATTWGLTSNQAIYLIEAVFTVAADEYGD